MHIVGVDIGGTFTDVAVVVDDGATHVFKVPTTPANLIDGVVGGLEAAAEALGCSIEEFLSGARLFSHGTTVATNTFIERRGCHTGLITTKGFGDTLIIQRMLGMTAGLSEQQITDYTQRSYPEPLVPRRAIKEVSERIDQYGEVVAPLNEAETRRAIGELVDDGIEALAVCFLWSFENPAHEQRVKAIAAEEAPTQVVSLLLSGPAGGVIGSLGVGALLEHRNIITADMGGTSFDASLIFDGRLRRAGVSEVGRYHVLTPMIHIDTIGAGGGSIASVNDGYISVGPESAGAQPGPACYGRGGRRPTVTDADVVLNFIEPAQFLGGKLHVDCDLAVTAIKEHVANPLGSGVVEAAAGIRRVVDRRMADLLRQITVEKGHDPRDFVLYAYGGAGPTHCAAFGAELRVERIVVPALSTVHSAYGSATANIQVSHAATDLMRTPAFAQDGAARLDAERIMDIFIRLEERCREQLRRNGIEPDGMSLQRYMEMRYRRQTHELPAPAPAGELNRDDLSGVLAGFERLYEERYGVDSGFREAGVEITRFRVDGVGRVAKPEVPPQQLQSSDSSAAHRGEREVYFPEAAAPLRTAVYTGDRLRPGNELAGAAIIEFSGTTIAIHPQQCARMDGYRNIHITSAE